MKTTLFALIVTATFVISACDVIEAPYLKNPINPADTLLKDTSDVVVKTGGVLNVLLEDYTGHTCGNCPEAAEVASAIAKKNETGRVVVVAVHAGNFALPKIPDYLYDFRTTAGTELDEVFRNSRVGLPNGLVNRVKYNGNFVLFQNNWDPATTTQLALPPALNLTLSHTYYDSAKTIVATVESEYLAKGQTDYSLVVWIVENGIIGSQTDYRRDLKSHVKDYEFEHVLRGSLNGTWGDQLSTTVEAVGSKIKKVVRYILPEEFDWKLANCELVAYVIRKKDDQTRDVVQVVRQKFRP